MRHRILATIAVLMFLTTTLVAQPYEGQKGDANDDGFINVLDILTIVNHMLGFAILDDQGIWRADLNGPLRHCDGDGNVNVLDIVKTANVIVGSDECPTASCPTVTDIDGNAYQTVQIGDQCWMAENLKVTHYRNGEAIQGCWSYNNNAQNAEIYGRLYDWNAVNDSRKIAPAGWHVPTDDEWQILVNYLGGFSVAGGKMKSTGTIEAGTGLWHSPNTGATNSSGFSALAAGFRNLDGSFYGLGDHALFWSATERNSYDAWDRDLNYSHLVVYRYHYNKDFGFSVRCLRDD